MNNLFAALQRKDLLTRTRQRIRAHLQRSELITISDQLPQEMDDETREQIMNHLKTIQAAGGSNMRVLVAELPDEGGAPPKVKH